jgi:Protein of unknown function (DUF1761)
MSISLSYYIDSGSALTAKSNRRSSGLRKLMNHSIHHLRHMNHWALLVSALILWFLGAVWYSPALFAKPWKAALGIVPGGAKKGLAAGMIASLVGDLLVAFALLHVILWSQANSLGTGCFVGFLCWFGFFAAIQLPQGIYEGRPFKLFAITGGYWLVGLLIIGGLLAVWK